MTTSINEHTVYDADDNVLVAHMPGRREELLEVARNVATERQAPVYVYGGNGRDTISPAPTVGCPATLCYYTDRHAGTVISVTKSGHKIDVREDRAIRTDDYGMSDQQDYCYELDPDGRVHHCYRQGDGSYKSNQGPRVALGVRKAYHDYSF